MYLKNWLRGLRTTAVVSRAEVVQALVNLYDDPSYLEIGVYLGETFRAVKAKRKVAVDPAFKISPKDREIGESVAYHEVSSDIYFGEIASSDKKFDVIYLDGLHTFEQTLRDLLNSEAYLKPNGVVIIDDVVPNSYLSSLRDFQTFEEVRRATGSEDGSWMGDVFRLVFFIDAFFQQYSYATVSENHGQLVLWRDRREGKNLSSLLVGEISHFEYSDVIRSTATFNLKTLSAIVELVKANLKKTN
jgi:hypothetical protein